MRFLILLLIVLFFCGCTRRVPFDMDILNGYYVSAQHSYDEMNLGFGDENGGEEVIGATIISIGCQDSLIFVKRHPRNFPSPPDKSITEYYIIISNKHHSFTKANVIGPLTESEFYKKMQEMRKIPPRFSIVF